jgi:hypothetical protein
MRAPSIIRRRREADHRVGRLESRVRILSAISQEHRDELEERIADLERRLDLIDHEQRESRAVCL